MCVVTVFGFQAELFRAARTGSAPESILNGKVKGGERKGGAGGGGAGVGEGGGGGGGAAEGWSELLQNASKPYVLCVLYYTVSMVLCVLYVAL